MYVRFGVSLVILSFCAGQDPEDSDIDEGGGSGSRELYYSTPKNTRMGITKRISFVDDFDVAPTPPGRKKPTKPSGPASLQPYWPPHSTGTTEPASTTVLWGINVPEHPDIEPRAETEMEPLTELEDTLDSTDSYNVTNDLGRTERQPKEPQFRAVSTEEETFTYPFAVSVQKMGSHYASGALVDHRWVLTVAEVFFNVRESIKIYQMRLGSVDCKKGGSLIPLKRIQIHPSYVLGKPSYDVALIQLGVPVPSELSDTIKPIAFSEEKEKVTKFLTIYWPRLVLKGEVLPSTAKEREKSHSMRVSTQRVIPWDKCYRVLDLSKVALSESTFCLKPVTSHHSGCMPDVGAPVVGNEGLWGITSGWVPPYCNHVSSPVMVTRIASPQVRNWLDSTMATY